MGHRPMCCESIIVMGAYNMLISTTSEGNLPITWINFPLLTSSMMKTILQHFLISVVSGGIGLLLLATKKSFFRVHRSVAGLSQNSMPTIKEDKLIKKTIKYRYRSATYLPITAFINNQSISILR